MSVEDGERAESEIRKRAAWLLAMLAVVAGLFVVLSLTLFKTSSSSSSDPGVSTDVPTAASSATPATSSSRPAASSSPATGASASSGAVPTPSCPGTTTCAVQGDITGAMSAINAYRAEHGKKAVPTTSSRAAQRCALTDGSDCPSSFVWIRVEDLSGSAVVKGVTGFNSSDDLLDDSARSYQVGWAYNPASRSVSCAVIRTD